MKQQHNRLTLSVMAALTTGIVLIYTLIAYHNTIWAVIGTSILFLLTAYFLIQNIIIFIAMRNKSTNVQLKNIIDDLSAQIENMSSSQTQIGKATYLYTRQTAQTISTLERNYTESQETLYQNLTSLSDAQNKAAKLMIKYDQNNTLKLVATLKNLRNQLNETMLQGFDQIKPNNEEIITTLQTIAQYLKTQSANLDQSLGTQLNHVAHELQNISGSIRNLQIPVQNNMTPVSQTPPDTLQTIPADTADIRNTSQPETVDIPETVPLETTDISEPVQPEMTDMPASVQTEADDALESIPSESTDIPESVQPETANTPESVQLEMTDILESIQPEQTDTSEIPSSELSDTSETTVLAENPAEQNPAPATEQKETDSAEAKSFTPSFTVVGKSPEPDTNSSPKEEAQPVSTDSEMEPENDASVSDDPNKQLSPDEIAALFAAADSSPKEEPVSNEPEAAPVNVSPVSDDPNKQLSPDEIAALFAAADSSPKEEPISNEPEATPVNVSPVSDDPNKQLSPDEIAALFAAADSSPKEEPVSSEPEATPVNVSPVSDDPNKQLSPDEIAALFAQMG